RIARTLGSRLAQVVPWGLYARVLLLAASAALLAHWAAAQAPEQTALRLGLKGVVFTGLYMGGIRGLGVLRALPAVPPDHVGFRAPG
ncbi:MAG TPA: hypothetical protein VL241_03305, partial [Gemmatimonadales bacterium]|nr:hypothetical protein [Gemmatimonadales bacterium]